MQKRWIMQRMLTAFILTAMILLVLGCSESPEEQQQRLIKEAITAANALDFPTAQEALKRLADLEPTSPSARFGSGYVFERQLQHYDALGVYMALTNTHPSFADAHVAAWRIFTHLGMMPEAMREAEAYRELLPNNSEAAIIMALSMIDSDLPNRAHPFLDSAVAEGANPAQVAMIHAGAYMLEDKPKAADSAYQAGLTGAGSSALVYVDAAGYLEEAGLIDSAIVVSRKAVTLSDNDYLQMQRHFELALRHHYFAEADDILAQFRDAEAPESYTSMLEAFRADTAGLIMPANEAIDRVIGLNGGTLSTRMYESAIKTKNSNEVVLLHNIQTLSDLLVNNGYDPEFQEVMFYLIAVQAAEWLDGKEALLQWTQIRPMYQNRPHLAARHALSLWATGQFETFKEAVAEIHRFHGRQPEWISNLADIYTTIDMQKWDSAAVLYAQALELDPWHQPAFKGWVDMLRRLDRFEEAAKLFDKYPHFAERFPALAMLEGICLTEAGQPEQGIDVFMMNARLNIGDEALHNDLYNALYFRSYSDQMRQVADWLMENGHENAHLLAIAARLRLDAGDYQGAIAATDASLEIDADLLDAKAYRARALYGMGNVDDAVTLLETNLKADRYHVPSTYWLSRILAAEGRTSVEAQNLARRALFDSGQGLREWLNLSYVYQVTGRYDLARGEATKMTRSFKGKPGPLFRLGMVFYLENKSDEARKHLQEAIDSGLSGNDLAEARSVLSKLKS